jgi:mono/diheme cytochrome c family protein
MPHRYILTFSALTAISVFATHAADPAVIPGDSARGAKIFQVQHCVQCHAVNGVGGKVGIDLGVIVGRKFTPASLASTMWNHGPVMWSVIESKDIEIPRLTPADAADLFAYFYSARFFDPPGDVARGQQTFDSRHCSACHGIEDSRAEGAPPVVQWESLADPVMLARQMWNHSYEIHQAFVRRKIEWQDLTSGDLTDILAYLRSLPQTRKQIGRFSNSTGTAGKQVFQAKGCAICHNGAQSLDDKLHNMTLTDIAVGMWNHAPRMGGPVPELSEEEMRSLLSYLWMRQFVAAGSNVANGKKVFEDRHCSMCHLSGKFGAPTLPGQARQFSEVTIISALWLHGPQMQRRMKQANIPWPMFRGPQEVADLIAYLNSVQ